MTQLLVSVRDADEALEALAGGADWIDLKEPLRGALGAVNAATLRDVVRRIAGRAPLSAAGGELRDWAAGSARELLAVPGWTHLKLGLAGLRDSVWQAAWGAAAHEATEAGVAMVAVIYADEVHAQAPPAAEILDFAIESRCPWLLIDTFDKSAGTLNDYQDAPSLRGLLDTARAHGQRTVVAGRLTPSDIRALPLDCMDMIGVRSAACRGTRTGRVDRGNVAGLCQLLSEASSTSAVAQLKVR